MSKFTENLFVVPTGTRFSTPPPLMPSLLIKDRWMDDTPYGYREYRVHATIGANFLLRESLLEDGSVYHYGVNKTKQKLVEELFGEFRQPLLDLAHKALTKGEHELAKDVDKILDQMFKV